MSLGDDLRQLSAKDSQQKIKSDKKNQERTRLFEDNYRKIIQECKQYATRGAHSYKRVIKSKDFSYGLSPTPYLWNKKQEAQHFADLLYGKLKNEGFRKLNVKVALYNLLVNDSNFLFFDVVRKGPYIVRVNIEW